MTYTDEKVEILNRGYLENQIADHAAKFFGRRWSKGFSRDKIAAALRAVANRVDAGWIGEGAYYNHLIEVNRSEWDIELAMALAEDYARAWQHDCDGSYLIKNQAAEAKAALRMHLAGAEVGAKVYSEWIDACNNAGDELQTDGTWKPFRNGVCL
jgi:hypothetical protein